METEDPTDYWSRMVAKGEIGPTGKSNSGITKEKAIYRMRVSLRLKQIASAKHDISDFLPIYRRFYLGRPMVIKKYVKQGDSMTMTISEQTHSPVGVRVNSYLNDPKDVVTISARFAKLPDGTNHVANTTINGVRKQLTVNEQNASYQKLH